MSGHVVCEPASIPSTAQSVATGLVPALTGVHSIADRPTITAHEIH